MNRTDRPLQRVLGMWDATCVVVGAIIGVGIFFTPKDVARVTGSAAASHLAWGIGALIALLGAFTFAELGRLRPIAGGQYHILRDAYGRAAAFLFVFCNLTAVQAGGVAIIAIICAQNLGVAFHGGDPGGVWVLTIATAMTWILVGVNVVGVRSGAGLQDATVVAKLVALGGLIALAVLVPAAARPASSVAPAPAAPLAFPSLFAGVTLTLFAYGGWQQALWMAGEVKDARRTVPRAIVLGVVIVVVAYLSANWAYFDLLGFEGARNARALAADAVSVASPGIGRRIAAAAVAISAFGVLNAQFLSGPRLTWAMAREGQFFSPFTRLHGRFLTPVPAIALLGALSTALLLGLGIERTDLLTTGVVVVDATFFALTGLALLVLRRRMPIARGGSRWTVAAAVAFASLELLAIAGSVLEKNVRLVALTGLAWIAAGALTWIVFFRRAPRVADSAADFEFELQPTLRGTLLELRPLTPGDFDSLYAAARDPRIWEQHPEPTRHEPDVFRRYFDGGIASGGALAIVDRRTGRIIGSSRYCNLVPADREVEIGWTFLEREFWGGAYNAELKSLMLDHAFQFVDRVVFVVGERNMRSQKALEKIGARFLKRVPRPGSDGKLVDVVFVITRDARTHGALRE